MAAKAQAPQVPARIKKQLVKAKDEAAAEKRKRRELAKQVKQAEQEAPLQAAVGGLLMEGLGAIGSGALIGAVPSVGPIPTDVVVTTAGATTVVVGAVTKSKPALDAGKGVLWSGLSHMAARAARTVKAKVGQARQRTQTPQTEATAPEQAKPAGQGEQADKAATAAA